MSSEDLKIRGRQFRTKSDYAAGWRDDKKLTAIEEKLDKNDPESVATLRADLENGKYHFETLLGEDFTDEIISLDEGFKRNPPMPEKGRRKGLKAGKKSPGDKTGRTGALRSNKSLDDYDEVMQKRIIKELKRSQRKRTIMLVVLSLCIIGSVGYLILYFSLYQKNDMEYNELSQMKQDDEGGTVVINYEEAKDKPPVLKKYEKLYQKNRRLVGWITIEACGVDYPVMQTSNNDYYLEHNYNQDYDKNGSIFMDKDCTPAFPNDNMIIYGHHMKSGKMFGNLNYYAKKDFWEKNKTFTFDTIYETGTYAVMYVFRSRIYSQEEIVFKYYQFIDASSADEFDSNMDSMAEMSLYDTGVTATYGDKLITLSTCDSSEAEGRFVVVAKKID